MVVRLQFLQLVRMFVRAVFSRVLVFVLVRSSRMRMLMRVLVLMRMLVDMFVFVSMRGPAVRVLMIMNMSVLVLVFVAMVVLAFHRNPPFPAPGACPAWTIQS